jgi:hypothetical protein
MNVRLFYICYFNYFFSETAFFAFSTINLAEMPNSSINSFAFPDLPKQSLIPTRRTGTGNSSAIA